ncbi:F-box protein At5g52880 [Nymphaea colorata]|nr:F-box protein At5g52880 [Nymphaea colorata]XP_031503938.1 F-box protein At5g52880 [Nymphaea colorata]
MLERYKGIGVKDGLSRGVDYPWACKELSFILRDVFPNASKPLRELIFHDTLSAFRFLPQVHTSRGISSASLLLQAAEAVLPKQKRALTASEYKHAVVACKRRSKHQNDEEGPLSLPHDVLVHIFTFLDIRSLATVGLVCQSWYSAANEDKLWKAQYSLLFGDHERLHGSNGQGMCSLDQHQDEKLVHHTADFDWKDVFKKVFVGKSARKLVSSRGYCPQCKSVIWLSNIARTGIHCELDLGSHRSKVKPISPNQVVDYLLGESLSESSSSESDGDSEETLFADVRLPKLWAYPRHIAESW